MTLPPQNDPEKLQALGVAQYKAGNVDLGLRYITEAHMLWVTKWRHAVAQDSTNHRAREKLAYHLNQLGRTKEAQTEYDRLTAALSANEADVFFHRMYGQGMAHQNRSDL